MANKKCPKCGEDNPAEAVMCWACYTPLTAGAGAAMTAGVGMGGAGAATMPRTGGPMGIPGAEEGAAKKQIDPKLFLVGGLLLVAAVIGLFTTGVLGGSSVEPIIPGGVDPPGSPGGPPPNGPGWTQAPATTGGSGGIGGSTGTGPSTSTPNGPAPPSIQWLSSPNPQYATATFAIAPSQPGLSPQQALELAKQARQSLAGKGKWKNSQIAVFASADSAQSFRQLMNQRKGAPLNGNDYASLGQSTWSNVIVYYETRGNYQKPYYPSQNPNSWWGR